MDDVFYNTFLSDHANILRRFQSRFHQANCTALACEIDKYFSSGIISRASGITSTDGYIQTGGRPSPPLISNLSNIISIVSSGSNGNHLVIEAENSAGRHHFANIIKIGLNNVYYVDGFNTQLPVCSLNIHMHLSWATIFHYSIDMRVRMA